MDPGPFCLEASQVHRSAPSSCSPFLPLLPLASSSAALVPHSLNPRSPRPSFSQPSKPSSLILSTLGARARAREGEEGEDAGCRTPRLAVAVFYSVRGAAMAFIGGRCGMRSEVSELSLAHQELSPEHLRWLCAPPRAPGGPEQHPLRSLHRLDLSRNALGQQGCFALSCALPYMTSLGALVLTATSITDTACSALAAGLGCCGALAELHLEENKISGKGVDALLPALRRTTSLVVRHPPSSPCPRAEGSAALSRRALSCRALHRSLALALCWPCFKFPSCEREGMGAGTELVAKCHWPGGV